MTLTNILDELYSPMIEDLMSLGESAEKIDGFASMSILVDLEIQKKKSNNSKSDFILKLLGEIEGFFKMSFNKYIVTTTFFFF